MLPKVICSLKNTIAHTSDHNKDIALLAYATEISNFFIICCHAIAYIPKIKISNP